MAAAAGAFGEDPAENASRVVVLYDFDPNTIDWPFQRQKPLPLVTGQVVQIDHDDGSDWALGHLVGQPETRGYFPKNYTMPVTQYHSVMREYEAEAGGGGAGGEGDEGAEDDEVWDAPVLDARGEPDKHSRPEAAAARLPEDHRRVGAPLAPSPAPVPVRTAFEATRSTLLRQMPEVPSLRHEEPVPPEEHFLLARQEVEAELAALQDPYRLQGDAMSQSRSSTPATQTQTRPDRDFVRRHLPMELQGRYLRQLSYLGNLVKRQVRVAWGNQPAYPVDMSVRSTTVRTAARLEPSHMRTALNNASANGARWAQMFRPGYNDIVNESMRTGCNACILSELYINDKVVREQFQKLHARDVNGILWWELQRRKDSVYYTRMDLVDVMMHHPDAWNFPDTAHIVSANPGEPIDPCHGWYAQQSINAEKEIQGVDFLYTLRLRAFPEKTFQALSLGKVPEWVDPYATVQAAAQGQPELEPEAQREREAAAGPARGKKVEINKNLMAAAGLEDERALHVKLDENGFVKDRSLAPDVLDTRTVPFQVKGLSAMRIFLRSRANPDNVKQCPITPKMVKDMAAQLGIRSEPGQYWYCMFALRYPLATEWEAVVRDDTRWYLHLPTGALQPIHPMLRRFREHLDDCKQNEFLWEYREPPVVKMKCSECGIPDSIVWCMQCTDYFCAACFFQTHRSPRGKKHWPLPIPGTRYLSASEAARLRDHLPLLNVGFSNRRRFLARDNQSDKNGSRNGDSWLFFHADTFQAALQQAPEKHWFLKRLKPPRLAPDVEGYYYNFANDVIADDASHIATKAHEQRAIALLQKNIRGAITRRRIKRQIRAATVIQKNKRLWDYRDLQGRNNTNGRIMGKWYGKFKAKQDKGKLQFRMSRVQAVFAGYEVRRDFHEKLTNIKKFQANFRALLCRRKQLTLYHAVSCIQRIYRGRLYGRKPMREQQQSASRIQGVFRGVAHRELQHRRARAASDIQAHFRGMRSRKYVHRMIPASVKIQRNWRRFQAQLDAKILVYEKLEGLRQRRLVLVREKVEGAAALVMQRNWRRHRDFERCVLLRREKSEADKRTSTMVVALFSAASSLRHYVHPFFRHLPKDIQEVLLQVKASMQRTVGLLSVSGKLASEELGRRGLRVAGAQHLSYDQRGRDDPDLASHMLLSLSRHLLSHLPPELFAPTVRWACYAVGHQAVALDRTAGTFPREVIPIGKEPGLPPHPGDSLATLWEDVGTIKHHHDWLMTAPDESLPCLTLQGLSAHHRHIFLTAQVLVTMRQALDSPSISTDDHLKFQGLDATAGAQLMEVLGSELDHRLPLDWPKVHGTVAALANQMSSHILELRADVKSAAEPKDAKPAEKATGRSPAKAKAKVGAKAGAKAKARTVKGSDKIADTLSQISEVPEMQALPDLPEGGALSHFNRHAVFRIVQQVGYYMCDQEQVLKSVLFGEDSNPASGVRQSRYISVTDKLFEMADRATHDHCSFALAVVLFHLVLRSLMLRVLYHRAAIAIQTRYRYLRQRGMKAHSIAPAIRIQRHWRGLRAALLLMRKDSAAEKIQQSYRAWRWKRRAVKLVAGTLKVQRFWHSAVHRFWLRRCHAAAREIQRFVRGMMVRASLDRAGRALVRRQQLELSTVLQSKSQMSPSLYVARTAALAAKARVALHRHRERNLELRRMAFASTKSAAARQLEKEKKLKMKGAMQPARPSVFEPMIFALKRLEPRSSPRYGMSQSRVMQQVSEARKKLNRELPPLKKQRVTPYHACSRRGRAAVAARRLAKKVPGMAAGASPKDHMLDSIQFSRWMTVHLAVKQ